MWYSRNMKVPKKEFQSKCMNFYELNVYARQWLAFLKTNVSEQ